MAAAAMAFFPSSHCFGDKPTANLNKTSPDPRLHNFRVGFSARRENVSTQSKNSNPFQEDFSYLWKLLFGSIGGAALIKYGCAIYPELANPNLLQAILMISLPVFISVVFLARLSMFTDK